jgi:hypothetical protein
VDGWENFAIAQVGAAAALAGLVLVGVSVNLDRILAWPGAVGRVIEPLAALFALLLAATMLIVPGQPIWVLGLEILCIGLADWAVIVVAQRRGRHVWSQHAHQSERHRVKLFLAAHTVLGQLAAVPVVAAGRVFLFGNEDGAYGVAIGAVGSFGLAFLGAWVLLVEISRFNRS